METTSLIPTRFKTKLPKNLSYFCSAREISAVLSELAAFRQFHLDFSDRASHWHSKWQKAIRERGEIQVLQCIYHPDPGEWDIHVYAVPSETRPVVRTAFEATAFPSLLRWIAAKRGARFSAHFDLETEAIRIEYYPP